MIVKMDTQKHGQNVRGGMYWKEIFIRYKKNSN